MSAQPAGFPRFWSKVDFNGPTPEGRPELGPCWVWTRSKNRAGYGTFNLGQNKITLAHRLAYDLLVGDPGPELDHLCRLHACVNPGHLEPVSHSENMRRGIPGQQKEFCRRGHRLEEVGRQGSDCAACKKIRNDARPRKTERQHRV